MRTCNKILRWLTLSDSRRFAVTSSPEKTVETQIRKILNEMVGVTELIQMAVEADTEDWRTRYGMEAHPQLGRLIEELNVIKLDNTNLTAYEEALVAECAASLHAQALRLKYDVFGF